MQLVITGANGFLGRALVDAAIRADHDVIALVRPGRDTPPEWAENDRITGHAVALDHSPALVARLTGADAVIHAAAAKTGDAAHQYDNTVVITQRLLAAMTDAGVRRLVGVSSFAVYDTAALMPGALLDETAPLRATADTGDAYARTKREQERVLAAYDGDVTILRPGLIYGPGALWQFALGRALGRRTWLRIGPDADELPWIYRDNCAEAIIAAATAPASIGACINLVDDERPGRSAFIARLNAFPALRRRVVTLPWATLTGCAHLAEALDRCVNGRLRRPGLLHPNILAEQFKPLRYDNSRAHSLLGWQPRISVDEALHRCAEVHER